MTISKTALSLAISAALGSTSLAAPAMAGAPQSGPVMSAPPLTVWCREQRRLMEFYQVEHNRTGDSYYWHLYENSFNSYALYCNF